jgi:hypothetical protein
VFPLFHVCVDASSYVAAQLLQKLSITAVGKREKLLNVIKNPVTRYLPVGARKIGKNLSDPVEYVYVSGRYANWWLLYLGLSYSAEKSVNLFDYVAKSSDDETLVFVVSSSCIWIHFVALLYYALNTFCLLIVPGWRYGPRKNRQRIFRWLHTK